MSFLDILQLNPQDQNYLTRHIEGATTSRNQEELTEMIMLYLSDHQHQYSVETLRKIVKVLGKIREKENPGIKEIQNIFHEALSILTEPDRRSRRLLTAEVAPVPMMVIEQDEEGRDELAEKDAVLWECIAKRDDPMTDGHFDYFRLRKAYNGAESGYFEALRTMHAAFTDCFPAVEMGAMELFPLLANSVTRTYLEKGFNKSLEQASKDVTKAKQFKKDVEDYISWPGVNARYGAKELIDELHQEVNLPQAPFTGGIFNKLGFRITQKGDEIYLQLPNRTALLHRWNQLRGATGNELSQVRLASDKGVATDELFVAAQADNDALYSSGRELLHDATFHVIPTLTRHLIFYVTKGAGYTDPLRAKALIVKQRIKSAKERVSGAEKVELEHFTTLMGAFFDGKNSSQHPEFEEFDAAVFVNLLTNRNWKKYITTKYPGVTFTSEYIRSLWVKFMLKDV